MNDLFTADDLSDERILELADSRFDDDKQFEFSRLLKGNGAWWMSSGDKKRLDELMAEYEIGLLRKSAALAVAVKRGLLTPFEINTNNLNG